MLTQESLMQAFAMKWPACSYDDITLAMPEGPITVCYKAGWRPHHYAVHFPNNPNTYRVLDPRDKQKAQRRVAAFIACNYDRLTWRGEPVAFDPDFYQGDDPQTLEEACAMLYRLYRGGKLTKKRRQMLLERFADIMHAILQDYAARTGHSYSSIELCTFRGQAIADAGNGIIRYNVRFLMSHPLAIRLTLVHELCHDEALSHGPKFAKAMEEALLKLGLLDRPCVYAPELMDVGSISFPPAFRSDERDPQRIDSFKGLRTKRHV